MIDGGAGFDVLRFIDPMFGSSFNGFSSQNDFLTFVNGYNISNIERVEEIQSGTLSRLFVNGSTAADVIDLSAEVANNYDVRTGSGNDVVTLGAVSGSANLALGGGIDIYNGGSSGFVFLLAGSGADIYNGGAAIETISYTFSAVGVNVNLLTGVGSGGFAAGETYSNIENITGTIFADTLIGDANSNTLRGRGGDDIIDGGAGNDTLETDGGNVTLTGGTGDDLFSFRIFNSSLDGEITDFELGDTLQIGQFFEATNGFTVPIFIGTAAFSNVVGEIRYEFVSGTTELQLDTDGDGIADDTLVLSNGEFDILDTETGFFDLVLAVSPPPINGTSGNDILNGTVNDLTLIHISEPTRPY